MNLCTKLKTIIKSVLIILTSILTLQVWDPFLGWGPSRSEWLRSGKSKNHSKFKRYMMKWTYWAWCNFFITRTRRQFGGVTVWIKIQVTIMQAFLCLESRRSNKVSECIKEKNIAIKRGWVISRHAVCRIKSKLYPFLLCRLIIHLNCSD